MIEPLTAFILGFLITVFFIAVFIGILIKRNEPHIQSRSPILMLIITFGLYCDSLLKLLIITTDYDMIDNKC